jgi:N-acetyl-anhydromuramyl-L-alanine amidase AmpD
MTTSKLKIWDFLCLLLALAACGCHNSRDEADFPGAKWLGRSIKAGMTEGRENNQVGLLILYTTEHSAGRAAKLWRESESVSGHYIITKRGEVWQFLRDADTGWHAGNRDYNLRSIAIAVEGFADPENPENVAKDTSWQTNEELESLANLIKWLCERYQIPIDRSHIIGKNQVPGVQTDVFPSSGPGCWGGASGKTSPGATWNWNRLMEKLGRKPEWRALTALSDCAITTLPERNAPIIRIAQAGEQLRAYDSNNGYLLVLFTGTSLPQAHLSAGHYHWDGWIEERFVEANDKKQTNIGTASQRSP